MKGAAFRSLRLQKGTAQGMLSNRQGSGCRSAVLPLPNQLHRSLPTTSSISLQHSPGSGALHWAAHQQTWPSLGDNFCPQDSPQFTGFIQSSFIQNTCCGCISWEGVVCVGDTASLWITILYRTCGPTILWSHVMLVQRLTLPLSSCAASVKLFL